jgi:selenide,water dikinase
VLRFVPQVTDPAVLVDAGGADDAAVIRISADRALVLTTDFFTPIVDDPYDFGRIAAANALSDVYAMGGRPRWCLSLVGWPRDTLPLDMLGEVQRGAADIVARAGAAIVGGHSIDDPEPKFGLMVVGEVHPDHITTNAGARPGDRLVLTKPIGSGIIATAIKRELAPAEAVSEAVRVMTTLNDAAAEAARAAGVRGATDVTGFGLLGHLHSLLRESGCAAEVVASRVPLLPHAIELVRLGAVPGGTIRNRDALHATVRWDDGIDGALRTLLVDAQTSGGLLLAVAPGALDALAADLAARGTPAAAVIGTVAEGAPGHITVRA